jgi:hypothetical protein
VVGIANDTVMPPDTVLRVLMWTWLPSVENDSLPAFLRVVEDGRGRTFVRLEQTVVSDVRSFSGSGPEPSRILTYIAPPPPDSTDQLSLDGCRLIAAKGEQSAQGRLPDGKSEILAITDTDDGSGRRLAVRRAWRADLTTVRITEIPASSVECWSEDNGGV